MSSRGRRNGKKNAGSRNPNRHRRHARGPKFLKARCILGFLCILASVVFAYRSCLAGIFKEGSGLGLMGLIPSVCLLVSGILAIQMLRTTAPLAFILPSLFCLAADVTSLIHGADALEWKVWGILSAGIAVVFLLLLCMNKRKNLEAPYVFLALTIFLTVLFLIFFGKAKETDQEEDQKKTEDEVQQEEENGTEEDAEVTPSEEQLFLAADKFTIRYTRHEVGEDVNGEKCLFIYYDFTNNSSASLSIPSVSYTKIIQNGAECGKASAPETNEEMTNYKTAVDPGMTVTACEVYAITDLSDVEFWAIEFVAAGGKEAAQILKLS